MTRGPSWLDAFQAKGGASQTAFVRGREAAFWVRARRNRLLAEWTCDLTDENNQAYFRLLLDEDFARRDSDDGLLLVKIRNDLAGFGVFLTDWQLREVRDAFERQAWAEREQMGGSGG